MTLTQAQLDSLVKKVQLYANLDDSADVCSGEQGIIREKAIEIDHIGGNADPGVTVTKDRLILSLDTGTASYPFDVYETIAELADAINADNVGTLDWVATLEGRADVSSDSLVEMPTTSALTDSVLTTYERTRLEMITEMVIYQIESGLRRNIIRRDFSETHERNGTRMLTLNNPMVMRVDLFSMRQIAVLEVAYGGTDTYARYSVTARDLRLSSRTNGGTELVYPFSHFPTVQSMVDEINTSADWTASLLSDGPTAYLAQTGPEVPGGVPAWVPSEGQFILDYPAGTAVYGIDPFSYLYPKIRIDYEAGFAHIPPDVELAILNAVKQTVNTALRDRTLASETLGDYSYSTFAPGLGNPAFADPTAVAILGLAQYERILP